MKKVICLLFCFSISYVGIAQLAFYPYLAVRGIQDMKKIIEGDGKEYDVIAPQQATIQTQQGGVLKGIVSMRRSYSGKYLLFRSDTKGGFQTLYLDNIQKISLYGADSVLCTRQDSTFYYRFPEISKHLWREVVSNKDGSFKLYDQSIISSEVPKYFESEDMLIYHNGKYNRLGFWTTFPKRALVKYVNKNLGLNLNKRDFDSTADVVIWLKDYFQRK